jgi:hypothetical protein
MRETISRKLLIRYQDDDGEYVFLSGFENGKRGEMAVFEGFSIEDARNLEGLCDDVVLEVFEAFQKANRLKSCEFVRITTSEIIDDFLEGDERLREVRQMAAISKLTESEIKALDLTNIAVYIKTKYHNT